MCRIESEKDRVVLVLGARGRDLCLSPDEAEHFAACLLKAAAHCERWMTCGGRAAVLVGGARGAHVKSWDGNVNVRLDSITDRESIPYAAAKLLAAEVRAKVPEARE